MVKTTIKKLEKSEVEIIGSIPALQFMGYENEALASMGEKMEIPGFRKGKAPANLVKGAANEMMILEEMAELALYSEYPKILEENKIDAIGRPQISITKIAKGNDLEFKIVTAVLPQIELPDYKKLAKEESAKNKIAGCNFVTERFSNRGYAKRQTLAHSVQNIFKIHEHSLSNFWAQIHIGRFFLGGTNSSLKH